MKTQYLLSLIRQACEKYNMISDGDRIAVGVSGGKDSLCLLYGLALLKKFYKNFSIEAITIDMGLDMDFSPITELCRSLGINHNIVQTKIAEIVFDIKKEKNPCSLCSKLRKGALNNKAVELKCNKIALGHNKDDLIETLLMSLFYEGRINCFEPVTKLDKTGLISIRPLIYAREVQIKGFVNTSGIVVVKNKCKYDEKTSREMIKGIIKANRKDIKGIDESLFSAAISVIDSRLK